MKFHFINAILFLLLSSEIYNDIERILLHDCIKNPIRMDDKTFKI